MKKLTALLLGAILLVGITACGKEKEAGNANVPTNTNASANAASKDSSKDALPTVDELITKSSEASKELKSFKMEADIDQKMTIKQGDQEMNQDIKIAMTLDYQKDPIAIYQVMSMDMGAEGKTDIEQYITNDGIYSLVEGTWVKLPEEMKADLVAQMESAANLESQLEQFKSIANESKVTEEGDEYVLSAELSGDGLKELAKNLMSQTGSGNEDAAAMLEMMTIKNIKLSNAMNKETYLPTRSDVEMEMDMDVEGQSVSMTMIMKSTISKQNEVEEIKIPQEVIDSAVQG
ncbi:DUF6612 family protein [Paenibacillus ihumii]|uniref:DUF6612 family protein n=1 Tax=Paenibacillus ihumii TaxID=687436 RepID=UPI0006D7E5D8|nr:DUF6612 family protein [Paenibacillus ihumii]